MVIPATKLKIYQEVRRKLKQDYEQRQRELRWDKAFKDTRDRFATLINDETLCLELADHPDCDNAIEYGTILVIIQKSFYDRIQTKLKKFITPDISGWDERNWMTVRRFLDKKAIMALSRNGPYDEMDFPPMSQPFSTNDPYIRKYLDSIK